MRCATLLLTLLLAVGTLDCAHAKVAGPCRGPSTTKCTRARQDVADAATGGRGAATSPSTPSGAADTANMGSPKPDKQVDLLPPGGGGTRRLTQTSWLPPSAPPPPPFDDVSFAARAGLVPGSGGSRTRGPGLISAPPSWLRRLAEEAVAAPRPAHADTDAARRLALFPPGDGPSLRTGALAPAVG